MQFLVRTNEPGWMTRKPKKNEHECVHACVRACRRYVDLRVAALPTSAAAWESEAGMSRAERRCTVRLSKPLSAASEAKSALLSSAASLSTCNSHKEEACDRTQGFRHSVHT